MINHYNTELNLESAVFHLIRHALNTPYSLRMVEQETGRRTIKPGFHYHESWEIFCTLHEELNFEVLGKEIQTFPENSLIIVPPRCMHMSINYLNQPIQQVILSFNLPGNISEQGILRVRNAGGKQSGTISENEHQAWQRLLKAPPEEIMQEIAVALQGGEWQQERAISLLHLLFTTFMEIIAPKKAGNSKREHVREALALLEHYYYDCDLNVADIADQVSLSPSHLSALFRQETGKTIYQTLIDLRMRRATELLLRTSYSIKEIADLTGWRNQLYFSAAFRRIHAKPPSHYRKEQEDNISTD